MSRIIKFLKQAEILAILVSLFNESIRKGVRALWSWCFSRFEATIIVPHVDIMEQYLSDVLKDKARRLRFTVKMSAESMDRQLFFVPADSVTRVIYKGTPLKIVRVEQDTSSKDSISPGNLSSVSREASAYLVSAYGRNSKSLENFVTDIYNKYTVILKSRVHIYSAYTNGGLWCSGISSRVRSLDSIILPGNQVEEIVDAINEFYETADWYRNFGVPHRMGFLFSGPPGTGKSSLVAAIAGELDVSIYIVNVGDPAMTDSIFTSLLKLMDGRHVLLLEDVDAAFSGRTQKGGLTLSAVLNAIDGISGKQGRLLFMTTNKVEELDPALIRKGRIDYRLKFESVTYEQACKLLERFWPLLPGEWVQEMASEFLKHPNVSMAQIQHYILQFKTEGEAAYCERKNFAAYLNED